MTGADIRASHGQTLEHKPSGRRGRFTFGGLSAAHRGLGYVGSLEIEGAAGLSYLVRAYELATIDDTLPPDDSVVKISGAGRKRGTLLYGRLYRRPMTRFERSRGFVAVVVTDQGAEMRRCIPVRADHVELCR